MSINADPSKIKALVFDLDGTILTPDNKLTLRTVNAIKKCKERGIRIIISTGRVISAAEPYRKAISAEGPMIYLNGSILADMDKGGIIKTTCMDVDTVNYCIDLARKINIYCQIYIHGGKQNEKELFLYAENDSPFRESYHKHTGVLAEITDLKTKLLDPDYHDVIKVMFLAEPEDNLGVRADLEKNIGEMVYIVQTYRTFLEILNKDISKGKALSYIMDMFSLRPEEVIAFGDEENDIPMFEATAFSAAPSSAKESVRAKATTVVGPNTEEGVAKFLEEFFNLSI